MSWHNDMWCIVVALLWRVLYYDVAYHFITHVQRRSDTSDVIYINIWSWLSANLHSIASRMIFGHRKLLMWWVGGVFSTTLKLSIRSRSITAIHLALTSNMNAVRKSQRHAMLLLTGVTLLASQNPALTPSWSLPHSVSDCCSEVLVLGMF